MKGLFVLFIFACCIIGMWAMYHRDDTDKNGYFKFQWRWIVWFIMLLSIPFLAKLCGLL
jgi:hypothetical protein